MNAKENIRKFICNKFDEENEKRKGTWKWSDVIFSEPKISITDVCKWMEEYTSQSQLTDEEIEKWAEEKTGEIVYTFEGKIGLIQGAKALRDGKIKQ